MLLNGPTLISFVSRSVNFICFVDHQICPCLSYSLKRYLLMHVLSEFLTKYSQIGPDSAESEPFVTETLPIASHFDPLKDIKLQPIFPTFTFSKHPTLCADGSTKNGMFSAFRISRLLPLLQVSAPV